MSRGGITNIRSLIMAVAQLFRKPFTTRYHTTNKNRIPDYDRIRGELIMNLPKCVGCGICVETCPNLALNLIDYDNKNPKNKKQRVPELDLGLCSFCALCVDECPYGVLEMGQVYDRAYLTEEDMHRSPEEMYEDWIEQKGQEDEADPEEEETDAVTKEG